MPTESDILTLAHWLSPAYPVGAFAYSHGLEQAVKTGAINSAPTLQAWLEDVLRFGSGASDAILLLCAYRAEDAAELATVDEYARALAPSRERLRETELQGAAFCTTTAAIWGDELGGLTYPVAVGRAARLHGIAPSLAAAMYLQAFAGNLVSAAIRLVPLGQTEGNSVLAALTPLCESLAEENLTRTLEDIQSTAFLSDIASMKHETLETRLFRS